jgi:hypothetical protein
MTDKYRDWIRTEAAKVKSDGCTKALELKRDCCYEHDLFYVYGRDPRDAFRLAEAGDPAPWENARKMRKVVADWRLGKCSKLWWRFPATLIFGRRGNESD